MMIVNVQSVCVLKFQSKRCKLSLVEQPHKRLELLLRLGRGAGYCDQFVCLSVCEHISGTARPIFTKFCVQIPRGRGSVLLWRRCDTLYTSGFMDDATFGRNGLYGDSWLARLGVAMPGRSLMSMNALLTLHGYVYLRLYTYVFFVVLFWCCVCWYG